MKILGKNNGLQAAIVSAIFLGLTPILGKQAIQVGFSPLAVVAFRTSIAMLLVLASMVLFRRSFFYIYPIGLVGCFLAGLVNGLGSIFYYAALSRLDASIGQLLYSFYPLFVAFWLLTDRQPIGKLTIVRLIISVPGVYLLLSTSSHSIDLIGAAMMLGAAALYALHLIINQRVLYEVPSPTVTFYTLLSMSLTVVIAYLAFDRSLPASGTSWWPVLILAVVTFISRLTLFYGVKHIGGVQTAILGLGELLVTMAAAQWWLGERLSPLQWIGTVLLLASLFLVSFDKPPTEKRRKTGWLAWLNPPQISPTDIPMQSQS
jgi:drug/metabolite transporter (DMT)-like permease